MELSEMDVRTRELIKKATAGDEVLFTEANVPVARIVPIEKSAPAPREPLKFKTYAMGFKGELPSKSEMAEEMFSHE